MDCDYLLYKIADDPILFALAFGLLLIALGLFIKIAGNPVSFLANLLKEVAPFALKELRGKAGKAAIINLIIVLCVAGLALVILLKPSVIGLFQDESVNSYVFSFVVFIVSVVVFLVSLKLVSDNEKFLNLYSKTK